MYIKCFWNNEGQKKNTKEIANLELYEEQLFECD